MSADWLVAIIGVPVGVTVGFLAGVRYAGTTLLPSILARLNPRELSRVANEASKLLDRD